MKTVLCVPGHDEHKVKNCRKYGADLILFDLEDSVPEGMKDRAREIVAANITAKDALRVNSVHADDLRMIDGLLEFPTSVWLPKKCHFPIWNTYRRSGNRPPLSLVVIVETPQMVSRLWQLSEGKEVRESMAYLRGLAFGAADFAAYMNVPPTSPQVQYARQQVALAAAALGVEAYDSPCTHVGLSWENPNSAYNDAYRALMLGYQWKGVVHPSQIHDVSRVEFQKHADRQLVDLYEQQSEAVMMIGDQLVAPPMIRAAKNRLENSAKDAK